MLQKYQIQSETKAINKLKLNFQLTLNCHSPSTARPLSISLPQPPLSAWSLISPPSTSSPHLPPAISPPHPSSSASVSQPLPSVPHPQPLLTSLLPKLTLSPQLPQSTSPLFFLQNSHYHQLHLHSIHNQPHLQYHLH